MANALIGQEEAERHSDPIRVVRRLLRAARVGTLATRGPDHPFASLVSPATAADLTPLLLLSDLSEHTKHLRRDPRCSFLVTAVDGPEPNPQTIPRITWTAHAEPDTSPAARERYLCIHPYAHLYAEFADFNLWRLNPVQGFFVGGFGRARTMRWMDVAPDGAAVAAIDEQASTMMAHWNHGHSDALAVLAAMPGRWSMVAVDSDGCDLSPLRQDGEPFQRVVRVMWPRPARDPDDVRAALFRKVQEAGAGLGFETRLASPGEPGDATSD